LASAKKNIDCNKESEAGALAHCPLRQRDIFAVAICR
jgi:hypothetical protein